MFEWIYWDITGSTPFDLVFSLVSFFAINGYIIKTIRSLLFGRRW